MKASLFMLEKELLEHKIVTRLPLFLVACAVLFITGVVWNIEYRLTINSVGFGDFSQDISVNGYAGVIGAINFAVSGFVSLLLTTLYLSKALRKEKEEGSIMFWRSMPITDTKSVMIKMVFALIIIPLVCSLLLMAADMMIWMVSLVFSEALSNFMASVSFAGIFIHWAEFVGRMVIASIALFPFASLIMVASQKTKHPIIAVFFVGYVLSLFGTYLLGTTVISDILHQNLSLPMAILLRDTVSEGALFGNVNYTLISLIAGVVLFVAAIKLRSDN